MADNKSVFREKSLDRISSPEKLDEYIRVASPGIWITLTAVLLLLIGFIFWAVVGKIDINCKAYLKTEGGNTKCYIAMEDAENVEAGMYVTIADNDYEILSISELPVAIEADDIMSNFLDEGTQWMYELKVVCDLPEGVHIGKIKVESVSPINFITN